jgi:hypothetical protein
MIQWYHSWASTQKNVRQDTVETSVLKFIAALFTIAKPWKQPSALQLMNGSRKCGTYTQQSITQPQGMVFEGKWMQLQDITLSEVCLDQNHKRRMFSLIYGR